jgi:hypothetical protein
LLRFGGLIPDDVLKQIRAAIEEGCEGVDGHEW